MVEEGMVKSKSSHEKKITYMGFIMAIIAMLLLDPFGMGIIWALAVVCLLIFYGHITKKRAKDGLNTQTA